MGTTGIVAQAYGKRDDAEIKAALGRSLLIAGFISLLLVLLQTPIALICYSIVDASAESEAFSMRYFEIRIWSAPAALFNLALVGWFIGMQNTRVPLILVLTINLCNIVLDLVFVVGLDMNVDGVALASVIAEYLGFFTGLQLIRRQAQIKFSEICNREQVLDKSKLRKLFAVNGNLFIRTFFLIGSFAFFTAQGAKQGDIILGANAILLNFQTFMAYGLDGFANAVEAIVGRSMGQADKKAFRQAVLTAGFWSVIVAMGFTGIYGLLGAKLIGLLTDIAAIESTAIRFLPWAVLLPLISLWSFLFDGVFIGATWTAAMRNTMLFSTFACFLPAWYLFQPLGNHGLWLAFTVFMAARGLSMAIAFSWLERRSRLI